MILDDLLIYGDWLEENFIKNDVYKVFLNLLRIKLRRNSQYGSGNGYGFLEEANLGYNTTVLQGGGYGNGFNFKDLELRSNYGSYSKGYTDGDGGTEDDCYSFGNYAQRGCGHTIVLAYGNYCGNGYSK